MIITFFLLETAAFFEVGSSLLFLVAMFVINGILLFEKEKRYIQENQENVNKNKHSEKGNEKTATIFASIFGSMAILIFIGGLNLVIFNPVTAITEFISGLALCVIGLTLCVVNIPIYRKLIRKNYGKKQ